MLGSAIETLIVDASPTAARTPLGPAPRSDGRHYLPNSCSDCIALDCRPLNIGKRSNLRQRAISPDPRSLQPCGAAADACLMVDQSAKGSGPANANDVGCRRGVLLGKRPILSARSVKR